MRVKLFQNLVKTGEAEWVGGIKPRLNDPAGIDLSLFYVFPAPNAIILTTGTTDAILNPFVTQYLSDSEHLSSPPLKRLFGGLK
jgi:hypothetical protein